MGKIEVKQRNRKKGWYWEKKNGIKWKISSENNNCGQFLKNER